MALLASILVGIGYLFLGLSAFILGLAVVRATMSIHVPPVNYPRLNLVEHRSYFIGSCITALVWFGLSKGCFYIATLLH